MTTAQVDETRPSVAVPDVVASYWDARRVVWWTVGLGVLVRAWVVTGGWFYWDDYVFQARAWRLPLGTEYLLYAHDGHFMPGAFLLQWPLTRIWPMNYLPLGLVLVAGQALLAVAFARLALALWGVRWQAVAAVLLVVVSPMTLPTNTWWAAALNGIPMQLALVVGLSAGLRWWRTGRRRSLLLGALVCVLALTFTEKVLIVPWVVLAAAPLLDTRSSPVAVWRAVLRRTWWLWAGVLVVTAAYVGVYLRFVGKTPANDGITAQVADLVGRGLTTTVPTGLLGGPLRWDAIGFGAAIGEPPWWFVALAVELMIVLVVASCLRSSTARRAWVWAAGYVLLDLALVVTGRLNGFVDPEVVQGLRYTADAVIPLALVVPLALTTAAPHLRRWLRRTRPNLAAPTPRAVAGGLAVVVIAASLYSTSAYRDIWRANDSRGYVAAATTSLAKAADGPSLVDQSVPSWVLYGLSFPYNQASWLLSPVAARPDWGDPTTLLRQLDDRGNLKPALVDGPANVPGPVAGCGYEVVGQANIPMQSRILEWVFTVRFGYIASGSGSATLAIGDGEARKVTISKGLHEVVLVLTGGGTDLRIRDLTPGVSLCTDDVRIGQPTVVGS